MQDNKVDYHAAIQKKAWQDSVPKQAGNAAASGEPGMVAMLKAKSEIMGGKNNGR